MAQSSFSYETFALPAFAAEAFTAEKLLPGGGRLVAAAFPYLDAVTVQLAAAAAADATSITVDAVTMANAASNKSGVVIPAGSNLYFGEAKEFARVTADVNLGATAIAVQALPSALEDNDTATYDGMTMRKPVAAGVLVGRTFAERTAGTGFGVADVATPDDEIYLTAFAVQDAAINPDAALLRHGTLIYEDKIPGWAAMTTGQKTAVRSRYQCIVSAG